MISSPLPNQAGQAEVHIEGEIRGMTPGQQVLFEAGLAGDPQTTYEMIRRVAARVHPGRGYVMTRDARADDHYVLGITFTPWRPVDAPRELDPQETP